MSPIQKLTSKTEATSTEHLLRLVEQVEAKSDRTEAERIAYAVACTTLCKRLDVEVSDVMESSFGPALHLRFVADMQAVA